MADPKRGTQPVKVEETPGKKAYCTCGWTENSPYCDGAHKRMDTGCAPTVCEVAEAGPKWVCQCGQTGNAPWCDGSHKQVAEG